MMTTLPTLQKRIRRAFLRLVLLFGALGVILVTGVFVSGQMPSLLVRMNYDSIAHVRMMDAAASGLRFPAQYPEKTPQEWAAAFDAALKLAASNITEPDEPQAVDAIRKTWQSFRATLGDTEYNELRRTLDDLVHVNERGMFRRLDRNTLYRNLTLFGAVAVFLTGTLWAVLLADSVSTRLSHPLRRMAESLKDRPPLGTPLHLPDPQTLEVRILFDELARQWRRLGELDAVNVDNLLIEKRKLEVILESADDAIIVVEHSGDVAHVSESMLTLLDLSAETVLAKPWRDLSCMNANYMALRDALRDDLTGKGEVELSVGGDTRLFSVRRRALQGNDDTSLGQVFLLGDVTEKRRREGLRSEMMDWISHELKTPIQSLGLAADLLLQREGMDEEMLLLVETVHEDAARLRTVARQFMDIARMRPGMLQLETHVVDLARRAGVWLTPFRLIAREMHVRLEYRAPDTPVLVALDDERFAWVVSNLVSNALRASPAQALLTVSIEEETGAAMFVVEDEGPGIPEDLEARMFEPFSHGRAAGTKQGLVGLGLAIARNIVEAHGGQMSYARRDEGGSRFTVRLPAALPPASLPLQKDDEA